MKGALLAGALYAILPSISDASPPNELRLNPGEIAKLPSNGAGPGSSGVSGINTRVLAGDPTSSGPYTIALSVPQNTRIAAHHHRDHRTAVVVSGTWSLGYGTSARDDALKVLPPGSFYTEPAGVAHFARTGSEPVTVYITGVGPTDTVYEAVDPGT